MLSCDTLARLSWGGVSSGARQFAGATSAGADGRTRTGTRLLGGAAWAGAAVNAPFAATLMGKLADVAIAPSIAMNLPADGAGATPQSPGDGSDAFCFAVQLPSIAA